MAKAQNSTTHWTGFLALAICAANGERGAVWLAWRYSFDRTLRRPDPVGIVRNGLIKRIYECAYCGARESMDARWRMPERVRAYRAEHNRRHTTEMLADLWRGENNSEADRERESTAARAIYDSTVRALREQLGAAQGEIERLLAPLAPKPTTGSRWSRLEVDGEPVTDANADAWAALEQRVAQ